MIRSCAISICLRRWGLQAEESTLWRWYSPNSMQRADALVVRPLDF
jgi:hypothetical protein